MSAPPIPVPCRSATQVELVLNTRVLIEDWTREIDARAEDLTHYRSLMLLRSESRSRSAQVLAYRAAAKVYSVAEEITKERSVRTDFVILGVWKIMSMLTTGLAIATEQGRLKASSEDELCDVERAIFVKREALQIAWVSGRSIANNGGKGTALKSAISILADTIQHLSTEDANALVFEPFDFDSDIVPLTENILTIAPSLEHANHLIADMEAQQKRCDTIRDELGENTHDELEALISGKRLHDPIVKIGAQSELIHLGDALLALVNNHSLNSANDRLSDPVNRDPSQQFVGNALLRWIWVQDALSHLEFSETTRPAFVELISHPGRFNRYDPGPALIEIKRALKPFSKFLVGLHELEEFEKLRQSVTNSSFEIDIFIKAMIALLEAAVTFDPSLAGRICSHEANYSRQVYAEGIGLAFRLSPFDVNSLIESARPKLAATSPNTLADTVPVIPASTIEVWARRRGGRNGHASDAPALLTIPTLFHFKYVRNPASSNPEVFTEMATLSEAGRVLGRLIHSHAIPIEPIQSHVRAILTYAFEMDEKHRMLWNKERVGGYVFHKLKRGRDRIYIRMDGENVWFHIYQRRDWNKSEILGSIRGAH